MKQAQHQQDQHAKAQHDTIGRLIPLLHPLRISRAQVLRRKCGHGISRSNHGNNTDRLDSHAGSIPRQHGRAESVDHRLYQQHPNGNNGLLQHGGNGDFHHATQHGPAVNPHILHFFRHILVSPQTFHQQKEGNHCRQSLGRHSSNRHTRHSHPESQHHQQIQKYVQHRRKKQQIQRRPGIAQGIKYRGQNIVHK